MTAFKKNQNCVHYIRSVQEQKLRQTKSNSSKNDQQTLLWSAYSMSKNFE